MKLFAIPGKSIPAFAFSAMLLLAALGLTFLLGRMSTSTPSQITAQQETVEAAPKKDEAKLPLVNPAEKENVAGSSGPAVKTVVKYVEIPVTKERIVERIVYLNKPARKNEIENTNVKNQPPPMMAKSDNPASQFNLRDLQPVTDASYRIIRKGENNEE